MPPNPPETSLPEMTAVLAPPKEPPLYPMKLFTKRVSSMTVCVLTLPTSMATSVVLRTTLPRTWSCSAVPPMLIALTQPSRTEFSTLSRPELKNDPDARSRRHRLERHPADHDELARAGVDREGQSGEGHHPGGDVDLHRLRDRGRGVAAGRDHDDLAFRVHLRHPAADRPARRRNV